MNKDNSSIFESYITEQPVPPTLPAPKPAAPTTSTAAPAPGGAPMVGGKPQLPQKAGVTSSAQSGEAIKALTQQLKDVQFNFQKLQQQVEVIEDWMDEQGGQSAVAQQQPAAPAPAGGAQPAPAVPGAPAV